MNKIIEFQTEFGTILIESEEKVQQMGTYRGSESPNKEIEKAKSKFEEAISTIKIVAESVVKKTKEVLDSPDEIEIKIGLKFTAEAGAIIAKTSAEGNLEVTLKWKNNHTPSV